MNQHTYMARTRTTTLSLLFLSLLLLAPSEARARGFVRRRSRARAFIEFQCQKTLYPELCTRYLSYHVSNFTTELSHQRLAQVALRVSLDRAESTRAFVTEVAKETRTEKGKYKRGIRECLDEIDDGIEQLKNCIKEAEMIKEKGGSIRDFPWHASNVKTWMSAAMTDASMCMDGFSGGAVGGRAKALVGAKVLNLVQTTSVSLALFDRFVARYSSSHSTQP